MFDLNAAPNELRKIVQLPTSVVISGSGVHLSIFKAKCGISHFGMSKVLTLHRVKDKSRENLLVRILIGLITIE